MGESPTVRQLSLALRFRHALTPRTFALLCLYAPAAVVVACSTDFPNEPDSAVTLETVDWRSEPSAAQHRIETVEDWVVSRSMSRQHHLGPLGRLPAMPRGHSRRPR